MAKRQTVGNAHPTYFVYALCEVTFYNVWRQIMDAVVIGSILAVGITILIVVFMAIRIGYLIKHTHSEDQ